MTHLALAVHDQERSRRFYESYLGFDAEPPRRYDDGVLMLYNARGFALGLGEIECPIRLPPFFHFGVGAESAADVRGFRDRLAADGIELVEECERAGLRQRQVPRPGRLRRRIRVGTRLS